MMFAGPELADSWAFNGGQVNRRKKPLIGTMQGRLLPKYRGRYQAHPVGYWDQEFQIARDLGLDLIEFIVDLEGIELNPLMSVDGQARLAEVKRLTGVNVTSLCADCFMDARLHDPDISNAKVSLKYLSKILDCAIQNNINNIVIPCVDQASLRDKSDLRRFADRLGTVLDKAEKHNINLALETDLDPQTFGMFLELIGSPSVTVNYDTGNSAALGYNPKEELSVYGDRISDLHIKDRLSGGGSVVLGTGNVDFDCFFEALILLRYDGPFIMQAYRDEEGKEIFLDQLNWLIPMLNTYWTEIST